MNVLKHELRGSWKVFLIWSLALALMTLAGMTKYEGLNGAGHADITALLDKFPKVILAMFGMAGIDIKRVADYYTVIAYLNTLLFVLYGLHLGSAAVSRETIDQTDEFLFSKPCSRSYFLSMKLLAAVLLLLALALVNDFSSLAALRSIHVEEKIDALIHLSSAVMFLMGLLFASLAAFFAALLSRAETARMFGNFVFFAVFILAILYDMSENSSWLRYFTPLKYFTARQLIDLRPEALFVCFTLILGALFTGLAYRFFAKKDLTRT